VGLVVTIAACTNTSVAAVTAPKNVDEDILGCYVYEKAIYENPLSSFRAFDSLPYVYGFDENNFIIANTGGGPVQSFTVEYFKTPIDADELTSKEVIFADMLYMLPDLSGFKERYLIAVMSDDYGSERYGLYQMDNEIWLVQLYSDGIWSI
jgi:hypothetical protein